MKSKKFITIIIVVFISNFAAAQVSISSNNGGSSTDYLGWDNTMSGTSLKIKTTTDDPITFHTNTVTNTSFAKIRMQISNTSINAPSGASFEVGRVQIRENPLNPNIQPLSLLHLGNAWIYNTGGHRSWMDVGTFTTSGSDNMYIGLKLETNGLDTQPWNDHMDAVINWGDNVANPDNFNDLRFIFTSTSTTLDSDGPNGLEMGRFSYNGNFGVGNFYNVSAPLFPIRPARRLEVLDGLRDQPQLRLTHTQQNGVNTGIYTDFQSLSTGDLRINPKLNAGNRFVGINNASAITTTLQLGANAANQSGLRFENLTSASPASATNGKVLTVDASGNVIVAYDDIGTGGVSFCPGTGLNNYIMKYTNGIGTTICQSQIFEDPSFGYNRVGIGTVFPTAKFEVKSNIVSLPVLRTINSSNFQSLNIADNNLFSFKSDISSGVGAYNFDLKCITGSANGIYSSSINNSILSSTQTNAGYFYAEDNTGSGINIAAIAGSAISNTNNYNASIVGVGGNAEATNLIQTVRGGKFEGRGKGRIHFGVSGEAKGAKEKNYGVAGFAINPSAMNYGVYGAASEADINYAVYGITPQRNCNNGSCLNAAGYFEGDLYYSGGLFNSSDYKLKQNINDIPNASFLVHQLAPKTYEFQTKQYDGMSLQPGLHYGLIAQDVENILPGLVKEFVSPAKYDSLGNIISQEVTFKTVNYVELIPILLAAIKEERQIIDSILNVINTSNIKTNGTNTNKQKIELSNNMGIILEQNDPNPFAEKTVINYLIPAEVKQAKIIFSDNNGVIIKTAEIESRGSRSLEVFSSQLSAGIYLYSLICDNKLIETKKMIKSE